MLKFEVRKNATEMLKTPFSTTELFRFQCEQHKHDLRNHFDIISLHKNERLKHYGLHFAKYVGRLARDSAETKPFTRTLVDIFLVSLSAANTLHQDLRNGISSTPKNDQEPWRALADAAGRFADACEKIDHMEEFVSMARIANSDILSWILKQASELELDLRALADERRCDLAARQFFITG